MRDYSELMYEACMRHYKEIGITLKSSAPSESMYPDSTLIAESPFEGFLGIRTSSGREYYYPMENIARIRLV